MSHFIFRKSPTDLRVVVVVGVLNTVESSEENKVFRDVTEMFVHEKYKSGSKHDDIALLNVGINFM